MGASSGGALQGRGEEVVVMVGVVRLVGEEGVEIAVGAASPDAEGRALVTEAVGGRG